MRFTFGKHVAFVSVQGGLLLARRCNKLLECRTTRPRLTLISQLRRNRRRSMSDDERGAVEAAEQHRISRPRASTAATAAPLGAAAELTPRTRP